MNSHTIEWKAASQRWLCATCLRGSDHLSKLDAERELKQYACAEGREPGVAVFPIPISAEKKERRRSARKKAGVQAELILRGRKMPIRVSTADLSVDGCYIENMYTLPIGAHLAMAIWVGERKVKLNGIVRTCDAVFGNGIEFLEMNPLDRRRLKAYLDAIQEDESTERLP
jgi:hypothetical protein